MKQFLFCVFALSMASCTPSKDSAYILPAGLAEPDKKEFIERFKKGSKLYTINCAKCHNTGNGKGTEPNFTIAQLENYELRTGNQDHLNHLSPKKVSSEDLREVIYYLRNKKKSK